MDLETTASETDEQNLLQGKPKWHDNKWWICVRIIACIWIIFSTFRVGYFIEDILKGIQLSNAEILFAVDRFLRVLTGAGILARQVWARYVGMVFAIFTSLQFPIGTLLGLVMFVGLIKSKKSFGKPVNQALDPSAG